MWIAYKYKRIIYVSEAVLLDNSVHFVAEWYGETEITQITAVTFISQIDQHLSVLNT